MSSFPLLPAAGTPARRIIDGAQQVNLFGEDIPVRAHIHTINGFWAHADQQELVAWHNQVQGSRRTFLVHGEEPVITRLAAQLAGSAIEMSRLRETFHV